MKANERSELSEKSSSDELEEGTGKCTPATCREFWKRAGLLALLCVVNLGFSYSYDSVSSLKPAIESAISGGRTHFDYISHVSTWPNIILTPAAGLFLDRVLSVPLGTVIYSAVACLGQLLFVVGGYADAFWLMLVGRFFFSAGEKMVIVATSAYVASWFKNKELAMAFGAIHAVTRIADLLSLGIDLNLFNALGSISRPATRLGTTLLFSLFLCLVSVGCAVAVFVIDRYVIKLKVTSSEIHVVLPSKSCCKVVKCKLDDLKDFAIPFWLIAGSSLIYYSSLLPFINAAVHGVLLERKYLYTDQNSNLLKTLVFAVSALVSPFLGLLIDYVGFHLSWFIGAIFTTLLCHITLAFSSEEYVSPIFSLVFLGIAVSLISVTLPSLTAYLVRDHQLGTAYGIIEGLSKLSPHLVHVLLLLIINYAGYLILEIVFSGLVTLSLLLVVILLVVNTTSLGTNHLNLSAWARREMVRAEELGRKAKYHFEELPDAWTSVNVGHHKPSGII